MPHPELLSQPWASSEFIEQSTRVVREALGDSRPIALLGAGQTGQRVASLLGDAATCFLDDTPSKQGSTVAGLPILSVDDGIRSLPDRALVVVCIFSSKHCFARTRAKLLAKHDVDVCSFANVLHCVGGLPNLYMGDIAHQVSQRARYLRLHDVLADVESRKVLDAHLRMRLTCDFSSLPDDRRDLAFLGIGDDVQLAFVDGGAFDGDTIIDFLAWRGDGYSRIVAFEPDPGNFARMTARVAALAPAARERITLRQAALWSAEGRISFDATGGVGSAISVDGSQDVRAETLASIVALPAPMMVKLDVEGAEREVLGAGLPFIREHTPTLAVSVYHQPDDLLDLFELLDSQPLGYRFFLRCHGGDGSDLTLYAVSRESAIAPS